MQSRTREIGHLWQHESYDHWVRDEDELEKIIAYAEENPIEAGLVETVEAAEDRPYSSAWGRHAE